MSNNDISKYFVLEEGSVPLASDSAFQSMSSGTVITNINSGKSYSKVSGGMCPVFNRVYIDNSVLYVSQRLTDAQKAQARTNIGIGGALDDVLRYSAQNLTNAQKAQARENIGVDSVLKYTEQSLTSAQKAQARENIGALATSDLPVATKSAKGIMQVGNYLTVNNGKVSVDVDALRDVIGGGSGVSGEWYTIGSAVGPTETYVISSTAIYDNYKEVKSSEGGYPLPVLIGNNPSGGSYTANWTLKKEYGGGNFLYYTTKLTKVGTVSGTWYYIGTSKPSGSDTISSSSIWSGYEEEPYSYSGTHFVGSGTHPSNGTYKASWTWVATSTYRNNNGGVSDELTGNSIYKTDLLTKVA